MKRDLANALVAAGAKGIAGYVQECVHSTSIGVDATFVFLMQLVDELDDAIAEFLPPNATGDAVLAHTHEVELGSLLSAASLTVRYVTEKKAMLPLLERYRAAFGTVLDYPSWRHESYLGLKSVAISGATRVLEAFGDQVAAEDADRRLRWLFALFRSDDEASQRLNFLLRPACEYATVAMQTHPGVRHTIFNEVLAVLMQLLIKHGGAQSGSTTAVKVELASTIAILLDVKHPHAPVNPFTLLRLPSFVEEMEPLEISGPIVDEPNSAAAQPTDDEEKAMACVSLDQELECVKVLTAWLATPDCRLIAAHTLPILYRAVMETSEARGEMKIGTPSGSSPTEEIIQSLKDLSFSSLLDFEFALALVEAMRDICLGDQRIPEMVIESTFWELEGVMPRLEVSLASSAIGPREARPVKAVCSKIRHALVETFLAWLHHHSSSKLLGLHVHFIQNVAGTLADPRVYGDALAVLRTCSHRDAPEKYKASLELAAVTICRALDQIDRYSKGSANRIVCGLTRIASACEQDLLQLADELVRPLLPSILDGSQWGKFLRIRTEAVATVLLGCAGDDRFQLDEHPWVKDFIAVLLDPVVSSENAHSLMILDVLIQKHDKLLHRVASFCLSQPHTVSQRLHEPLHRWPIYEEDIELVVVTLHLMKSLLKVESLRKSLDADVMYATILQLADNAEADKLEAVASACRDVLAHSLSPTK